MEWSSFQKHVAHLPAKEQKRIHMAFDLGKKAHAHQKRKSGKPYFIHPIAVAEILIDLGADADTIIAALLHDTVEDTDVTLSEVEKKFGSDVATLIDGVTKIIREEVEHAPGLDEQIETIRKMFVLMEDDVRIMVIKLADRLHNMQTIEFMKSPRKEQFAQETLDVYIKIADRLAMQELRNQLAELALKTIYPKEFVVLAGLQKDAEKANKKNIGKMQKLFDASANAPKVTFEHEPKRWTRMFNAIREGAEPVLTRITVCIVCSNVDACYRSLGILHQIWQREHLSFNDFINTPMVNGYQGLHTTLILSSGMRVRCKIRTQEMHEYAQYGVTTSCFGKKGTGVLENLSWTQLINALSSDTKERSEDFFTGLQSDILGDSIVIHGLDDQVILVPKNSTVLDGLFYAYGEEALYAKHVLADGVVTQLWEPLQPGMSLEIEPSKHRILNRDWLKWATTGYATAKIHAALKGQSRQVKQRAGYELMQEYLVNQGKGYLEELSEKTLDHALVAQGYDSLEQLYIAIAEGDIEPIDAYRLIFSKKKTSKKSRGSGELSLAEFTYDPQNFKVAQRLMSLYNQYSNQFIERRFMQRKSEKMGRVKARLNLTLSEREELYSDLKAAGAESIAIASVQNRVSFFVGIAALIIVWGLDPVVARMLLTDYSVSAIDLTLVRFWSLSAFSGLLLGSYLVRYGSSSKLIELRSPSLWGTVLALVATAITTYAALQITTPSQYTIPMTSAGLLLTTIVNWRRKRVLLCTWSLVALGVFLLVAHTNWSLTGMVYTLLAVVSFSTFSLVSEKYKREANVDARADQYFFFLSLFCALVCLPLLAKSNLAAISTETLVQMVLFSVFLSGLPYYLYYFALSHKQIDYVLRYSFLIILSTTFGEALLIGSVPWLVYLAGGVVTVAALLPLLPSKD